MAPSKITCPLCGKDNACGMANGGSTCWCFDVTIPRETLEKVPEAARSVVCICKACASGSNASEDEDSPVTDALSELGVGARA